MKVYARSDVDEIALQPHMGGCGRSHGRKKGQRLEIDCPHCGPALIKLNPDQFSANAAKIPLTPDEEDQAEVLKVEADKQMVSMHKALAEVAREAQTAPRKG